MRDAHVATAVTPLAAAVAAGATHVGGQHHVTPSTRVITRVTHLHLFPLPPSFTSTDPYKLQNYITKYYDKITKLLLSRHDKKSHVRN